MPAIDPKLLQILACPATHQSLTEATSDQLASINAKIQGGGVRNVGGEVVSTELEAALMREDQALLYPILDGIPVLLENEGIALG
jgi:uncharacterized protein YbaR (Trm112 family)